MAENGKKGKLVIISGFSGVGKGTLVKKILNDFEHYALSVSMTTRKPREGEEHGVNYYFVSNDEFEKMIGQDGFLEHAGYVDHYYGTPRDFVEEKLAEGTDVILEIEVQGAMQIKKKHPDAILIFVTTPDAEEMARRLLGRQTENAEQIINRLKRAVDEAEHMKNYDYIVVNDKLEDCAKEINSIVEKGEGGVKYDPDFKNRFVGDLRVIIAKMAAGFHKVLG